MSVLPENYRFEELSEVLDKELTIYTTGGFLKPIQHILGSEAGIFAILKGREIETKEARWLIKPAGGFVRQRFKFFKLQPEHEEAQFILSFCRSKSNIEFSNGEKFKWVPHDLGFILQDNFGRVLLRFRRSCPLRWRKLAWLKFEPVCKDSSNLVVLTYLSFYLMVRYGGWGNPAL